MCAKAQLQRGLALAVGLLAAGGAAGEPRCTAGILDSSGQQCCPRVCGACGGVGCESRRGGGAWCCGGSIKELCSTSAGPPPCSYPAGWPPGPEAAVASTRCQDGVISAVGDVCCSRSCGTCGGPGCDGRPGGAAQCCGGSIRRLCSSSVGAPCVYAPAAAQVSGANNAKCAAGILDASGEVCCAKACGQCGGDGCDTRPGGGAQCCGGSVQRTCATAAGPPPCRYVVEAKPPESAGARGWCLGGVESEAGDACCPRACGICGGPQCAERAAGASQCCGGSIAARCSSPAGPPPCIYPKHVLSRRGEL